MADQRRHDPEDDHASLELPRVRSLFRRRKRTPEPAGESEAGQEHARQPVPEPSPAPEPAAEDTSVLPFALTEEPAEAEAPRRRRPRRPIHIHLPGPLVALLTGAVVGLALVGLTSAGLHLCSSMRGTSSCGTPGLLVLLVITLVAIVLGSLLLRLFGVGTHGSTSFLGVGLLVVVILIALLPVLDDWWVVIVVPALAMITFVAAWWLTTTYVEPGERAR